MKNGWDIPVILQPEELLSSWLVRVALANGCDPLVISWAIWDKWRGWANDIDRNPGNERLVTLSNYSGESLNDLQNSTLFPIALVVLGREPIANELWPWILTTGTRNRIRKGGLQYCVDCLKEDKKPYYRRKWRLAWHVSCIKHGKSLLDCCPHCQAPIEPHRLVAKDRVITKCASCHLSLLEVSVPLSMDNEAQRFQLLIDNVFFRQLDPLVHGNPSNVSEWFDAVRYYESFTRRCILTPHPALKSFAERLSLNYEGDIKEQVSQTAFEQMNVRARSSILREINKLMRLSQAELLEILKEAGVSKQGYSTAKIQLPHSLSPISLLLPDNPRPKKKVAPRKKNEQATFPKPKPKWEVERMWRQLLKKIPNVAINGKQS